MLFPVVSYSLFISGLKEYIEANPGVNGESSMTSLHSPGQRRFEDAEVKDEFYDAIAEDSSSSEEESEDDEELQEEVFIQ